MAAVRNSAKYDLSHTIAAEATPPGRGGVSVIRVSGSRARSAVGGLFDRPLPEAGRFRFGNIVAPEGGGRVMDQAVVSYFRAPHSYTGEDVVEITLHGSPVVTAEVLELLFEAGVRPASPGEFTYRAFINDRIDLVQAEAVADLVASKSLRAAEQAVRQLEGGLGRQVDEIGLAIRRALTSCELELDFVEEDLEPADGQRKLDLIERALDGTARMLDGYRAARHIREGVKVAVVGPVNVGKSSLFNRLTGEEHAIVHPKPGTTRDVLHESTVIRGVAFEFFDTAGMRRAADEVEDEGVRRAMRAAEEADILLDVRAVDEGPVAAVECGANGNRVCVLNKMDLAPEIDPGGRIPVSAKTGLNLDALKSVLFDRAVGDECPEGSINRERHFRCMKRVQRSLELAKEAAESGHPAEIVAEELHHALDALDELTGRRHRSDLLSDIFRDFCIGK